MHFRVGGHLGINIDVPTLQALHLAPSLCLVPPRWVCCPAMGRNLDFSPAPQPASPTGRRNLPCSVTNSLGLRSLLSDNLSLDTGDQKILHFLKVGVKVYKTDVDASERQGIGRLLAEVRGRT